MIIATILMVVKCVGFRQDVCVVGDFLLMCHLRLFIKFCDLEWNSRPNSKPLIFHFCDP